MQWLLLLPIAGGSLYSLACLAAMARIKVQARRAASDGPRWTGAGDWPAVSVLRPIYGLTKNLRENLESVCRLDYPHYQVVLSAQREDEPALPLLYEIQRQFGCDRVTVVVNGAATVPNGKARNLLVGYSGARHDLLVVSDSDVCLRPDYLKTIVAPFADARVGCVSTLYRAAGARRWFERMEQLFINADWVPNLVFAHVTHASPFVLGATNAVRRSTLDLIGGWADLGWYVLEDFEMGRRIRAAGQRVAIVPYFVDTLVDLDGLRSWWRHQLYWDKNTRAANAWGLFGTLFIRAIPFGIAFAVARHGDLLGWAVAAAAVALRLATAGLYMGWGLEDRTGVSSLPLMPLRDIAGFVSTVAALCDPTVIATGQRFAVGPDGRLEALERSA